MKEIEEALSPEVLKRLVTELREIMFGEGQPNEAEEI